MKKMLKTCSKAIQWVLAVTLGIAMLGAFTSSAVSGFLMLFATVIVCPFTREKICTFLNNKLGEKSPLKKVKGWVYGVIVFLLVGVAASASPTPKTNYDEMIENINEMQTVIESLEDVKETDTMVPVVKPTSSPTPMPMATATPTPTLEPTASPSPKPTLEPTASPSPKPTLEPMAPPSPKPTLKPTAAPTPQPTDPPTPEPVVEPPKISQNIESIVWIPQSGKKYHSHSGCSGMKNPSQVTLSDAQSMGFTACSRCY